MAAKKLSAAYTIFILSLFLLATFTNACGSCGKPIKPSPSSKCPRDTLKLGACADVLGLVNVIVGTPPYSKCCAVLEGLSDLEAAACLCTAIKANVLGLNLTVPVALSSLVSACGRKIPSGFQCG